MPKERILSADSHVAIRDDAVLRHLPQKHHEAYQQARMVYIQRMIAKAKPKHGEGGELAAFQAFNDAALEFASRDSKRLIIVYLLPIVGLGWIPFFLERLDTMKKRHGWDHYDMLEEPPSHYWRRNVFATFEEDTFGVSQRERLGVENLMWATDYPHPDSTWPHSQQVLATHFADVPREEARAMIGGNAARIYRL